MATIKSYTDLKQSKKLKEILSIESADMIYLYWIDRNKQKGIDIIPTIREDLPIDSCDIPCWSLAALLTFLKDYTLQKAGKDVFIICENEKTVIGTENYENPVDACVAMIEKLHELKML